MSALRAFAPLVAAALAEKIALAYDEHTIFDVLNDLRRYDDACSVRVGVAKLQELAQAKKADEEQQSETLEARKIIDAQKKSLASQKQAIGERDAELAELKSALEKAHFRLKGAAAPALPAAAPQVTRAN